MSNTKTLTVREVTSYSGPLGTKARYGWAHVVNQKMPKALEFHDNMFLGFAGLDVFITTPPVPGRRKHRMKANMPCGRTISAGRFWQHGDACAICKSFISNL
jgi:hypothetical protein